MKFGNRIALLWMTATFLGAGATSRAGDAGAYESSLDKVDCEQVAGWIWAVAKPNTPVKIDIVEGTTVIGTFSADKFRQDLKDAGKGDGNHAFSIPLPASLKDGKAHTLKVKVSGEDVELHGSPQTVTCDAK